MRQISEMEFPRLEWLKFGFCENISDEGLPYIGQMDTVYWLSLMANPQITDAGLPPLLNMGNLKCLDLRGCPGITDRGLEILGQKTDWQVLMFGGCGNVTTEAVARLQAKLPNAQVEKDNREWQLMYDSSYIARNRN